MVYVTNKCKYYMEDIFEKGKYIECSEDFFNETVVRFRSQYKMEYENNKRIFTEISSGWHIIKEITDEIEVF